MRKIRTRSSRRSSRCGRPKGAPNVLVVLLDDVGFGAASAFGGPVPNAERWSDWRQNGLKYTRFHTTALCSPTRQALLTGRNHHSVGHGRHHRTRDPAPRLQLDTAEEQGTARQDAEAQRLLDGAVRQVPRGAGLGDQPVGPFDQWPTGGGGFEYFYGFIGGETNQWYPALYEGTTPVEAAEDPGRGLSLHRGHDRQGDRAGCASRRR